VAKRREASDLYATILEVVKAHRGEARITRMSYGAGMPVDRLRPIIDRLLAAGLLAAQAEEDRTCYQITPRGHEYLSVYWKLKGFTESLEGDPRTPNEFR
jgi:predicted transcriptional regulator